MGNEKKTPDKSRRWFLSLFVAADDTAEKPEMIKMLTPEGKLVEVDKKIFEAASAKKKATYKEVFDWMKNPSKENS